MGTTQQYAELDAAAGSIAFRFEGRDVNLVMAPAYPTDPARFGVLRGADHQAAVMS